MRVLIYYLWYTAGYIHTPLLVYIQSSKLYLVLPLPGNISSLGEKVVRSTNFVVVVRLAALHTSRDFISKILPTSVWLMCLKTPIGPYTRRQLTASKKLLVLLQILVVGGLNKRGGVLAHTCQVLYLKLGHSFVDPLCVLAVSVPCIFHMMLEIQQMDAMSCTSM